MARKKEKRTADELKRLRSELSEVNYELHGAYRSFNDAVEEPLIQSSIFEINMLQERHSYLLRRVKALMEAGEEAAP